MQLLSPIGLFALLSLLVPLVIHLWNVKQGKTLKIGSISLLGESSKLNSKSLRLTDWPLFLVRCLLLVILTIILADPYLITNNNSLQDKGWVMMKKENLKVVYNQHKGSIDSLMAMGYKLHDFNFGFKEMSLEDTVGLALADTSDLRTLSLLTQLNTMLVKDFPVVLYADKQLLQTNQKLPLLNIRLKWNAINDSYNQKNKAVQFGNNIYSATLDTAYLRFKLLDNKSAKEAIRIAIYQESNTIDAKYLISAIRSIGSYRNLNLEIKYMQNQSQLGNADLIFWLSERLLTDKILKTFKNTVKVFAYVPGKAVDVNSMVAAHIGSQTNGDSKWFKRIVAGKYAGTAIWSDFNGTPILTKEQYGGRALYKFYSRFNQSWTNLVWQDQFVRSLIPIISPEVSEYEYFGFLNVPEDQRLIHVDLPRSTEIDLQRTIKTSLIKEPLNHLFWVLAFCLFCLERYMAFSLRRRAAHG